MKTRIPLYCIFLNAWGSQTWTHELCLFAENDHEFNQLTHSNIDKYLLIFENSKVRL